MDPRTERTRQALTQTALTTLEHEGWEKMTPRELCQLAGVARSTFYVHYADVSQVVVEGLLGRFAEEFPGFLGGEAPALDPETLLSGGRPLSYAFYAHVEQSRALYQRLFEGGAGAAVLLALQRQLATYSQHMHAPLREVAARDDVDPGYLAHLLAGALIGTLSWWLVEADPPPSALKMSYEFSFVVAPGVLQRLGLEG